MNEEWLSVPAYAKRTGRSISYVYRLIRNNRVKFKTEIVDGSKVKLILLDSESTEPIEPKIEPSEVQDSSQVQKLTEEIERLRSKLDEKDKQISMLIEQNSSLTRSIAEAHALQAGILQKLPEPQQNEPVEPDIEPIEPDEVHSQQGQFEPAQTADPEPVEEVVAEEIQPVEQKQWSAVQRLVKRIFKV